MFVGFAVLMAVVMKSSVVWDLMPCSSLKSQPVTLSLKGLQDAISQTTEFFKEMFLHTTVYQTVKYAPQDVTKFSSIN
jgi:hypothetical protein